ncbi:MAG: arginine deiminase family protein [Acidobacteriota bacterium]
MRALVRAIPDAFARATVKVLPAEPIDVPRARVQHAAYVAALRSIGVEVRELPPLHVMADSPFVEDTAVVAGGLALIDRMGNGSRRGEEASVRQALGEWLPVAAMEAPATLEGGDCMRLGRVIYAGLSERSNAAGIARLREVMAPRGLEVVTVELGDVLHLKCVCSPLDETTMLLAEGTLDPAIFGGARILAVPAREGYASNALAIGRTVLLPAGFPETRRLVAGAGFDVVPLDTTEIRKADGALTCLSILF